MFIYIVIFYLAMLVVIKVSVRDVISKTSIIVYLSWWIFWLLLSTFNPYRLYSVSSNVYLLLMLNVFMFSFGFILYGIIKSKANQIYYINNSFNSFILNNYKFKIILVFLLVAVCYFFIKYLSIIQLLGAENGRNTLFEVGDLFINKFEIYLFSLIVSPFSEFLIIVLISLMLFQRKIILLFLCLFFLIFYGYIGSGRSLYISILIALVFIILIKKQIKATNIFSLSLKSEAFATGIKRKFILTLFVVLVVILLSYITAQRMGNSDFNSETIFAGFNDFGKHSVIYMTGPFRALDYAITHNYVENTGLFYGRATFAGFDSLLKMFIHGFGGTYKSANDIIIPLLQNEFIPISSENSFNFAYTNVMIHLFDFGLLGVFLFPFLFGLFVRSMYYKFIKAPTFPMLVIIVYIFESMIFTVFKWSYQFSNPIILIIILYFLHKSAIKKNRKISENIEDVVSK